LQCVAVSVCCCVLQFCVEVISCALAESELGWGAAVRFSVSVLQFVPKKNEAIISTLVESELGWGVAVCCSVVQCVAVCVAVSCSVLKCVVV